LRQRKRSLKKVWMRSWIRMRNSPRRSSSTTTWSMTCMNRSFELLTYMLEDPRAISRAIKLIFIAKHLERVGDHSANIAEMVIFLVRGQDIRHGTRLDRGA